MRLDSWMSRKTLLFLGADNFHARTWKNGELSAGQYFSDDAEGRAKFSAFLQAHRDPALLLADLVEEDFRHEAVPHLRGSERAALVRRKLEQHYPSTPFRQAITLQRRKDGRRDDDMLFSALTNPALISPWLNIMLAHNIALEGIYSIPNISAPLVKDIPSANLLLLSWEKHAGLRQTYFDEKLLRFSRLTPINGSGSFGASAGTEVVRTQQYLKNLGLLAPGQALNVHIICHADDRRELEAQLNGDADMRYAYLDIQELGPRIGSKTLCADSDATPLFLHLLAAHPPRSHYAAAKHTHLLRLLHVRRALLGLCAGMAASAMLWAGTNIMEGVMLEEEGEAFKAGASQLSRQARQIIEGFPNTLASATDMKTAVILSRQLNDHFPPPQTILGGLGETLNDFPSIRIGKLSWQVGAPPADEVAATAPAQNIFLDGELTEFTGDYRAALDHIDRFQKALAQRGYSVTALALPLDISPQGSIAADAGDGNNKPAQFSLRISWRPPT